ncbi:MAG: D-aminoacylase [Anaerolineaceae bacterium]
MYDLIIQNGRIIDGSGNPWFRADLAIKDGKIVKIARKIEGEAKRIIDAKGLTVAPGFCDLHTHSDESILYNQYAKSSIHAGVTTEGVGQCGTGAYSFADGYQDTIRMELFQFAQVSPDKINVNWRTVGEWRSEVEKQGVGINLAPYIPHGVVRNSVMGPDGQGGERYEPTEQEMEQMKQLIRESMEEGAFGMSTGLRYPWGRNCTTEEIIELSKVVAEYNGIYISHMRSESDTLIESTHELVRICEEAGIPGSVTHHKAKFPENFGKVNETLRIIDRARARGVDVICDFYPWVHAAEGNLGGVFLPYLLAPDMSLEQMQDVLVNVVERITDGETWAKVKAGVHGSFEKENQRNEQRKKDLEKYGITAPALWSQGTFNYIVYSPTYPELEHKNLIEAARILGFDDYLDAARKIYIDDQGATLTAGAIMAEEDVVTVLKHPYSSISTDGAAFDRQPDLTSPIVWAHPRNYGTFAKVLGEYARDSKYLRLEEAVRKMTSLPMNFLGITDRGLLREGMWADITIFNADTIQNKATFANPAVYPDGIEYVLVNGAVALDHGRETGSLAGKVLWRG